MTAADQLRWDEIDAVARSPEIALRYAEALIAIVGQDFAFGYCSECMACVGKGSEPHEDGCAWLVAARALGIAD